MTDTPGRHAETVEDPQVAPSCGCGSHCGPQCRGLCDPHAIRIGLDEMRAGALLLIAAVACSWAGAYVGFRIAAVVLLAAAGVSFGISRHRRRG